MLINLNANKKLKALGCKWSGSEWVAPKLAQQEAAAIKNYYYSDLIAIEVKVLEKLQGADWGYKHVRLVGGYIVAYASGRDSGAIISEDVAVISGKFSSAGSVKNYICEIIGDVVIRLEVGRKTLELLDEEVANGWYEYKIIENAPAYKSKEELIKERAELIKEKALLMSRIKQIDLEISGEDC